jgi:Mrp family chromosome partitioning ATPase
MSAIDRAFIRAYEVDDGPQPSVMPLPSAGPGARRAGSTAAHTSDTTPTPHFRVHSQPASIDAAVQRRPLSTFAAAPSTVEARFRPGLEVDGFHWSATGEALISARPSRWDLAIRTLLAADQAGCSLIGVGGSARGAGATTVAGCLSRLLIAAGKTVAVVDGDFATAGLARSLGIAAEIGWEDVLAGRVPLADAVIHSLDDRLAVLPLVQGGLPAAEKLDGIHASITAGVLRYHYDIVLFDLGAVADPQQGPTASRLVRRCRLDGMLLAGTGNTLAGCEQQLRAAAPELADICLGVIENHMLGA